MGVRYPPYQSSKYKPLSYFDVVVDKDGWADASRFFPADFDMVQVKTENGEILNAWSFGKSWDGYRITPDIKILFWKRKEPEDKRRRYEKSEKRCKNG